MVENPKSQNNDDSKKQIGKVLEELCLQNESGVIEADIVALFEDIAKLFDGREEEFLKFDELSTEAKKAIYMEIKNIIDLLQRLKGAQDKEAVMEMLGENLVVNFVAHSGEFKTSAKKLNKQEQIDLKRRLADTILLALYRQRQLQLVQDKAGKPLSDEIEKYVGQLHKGKAVAVSGKETHLKALASKKAMAPSNKQQGL